MYFERFHGVLHGVENQKPVYWSDSNASVVYCIHCTGRKFSNSLTRYRLQYVAKLLGG